MKELIIIISLFLLSGCVYLDAGKDNVHDELNAGGGFILVDGHDNLDDCFKAWNDETPPSKR